MYDRILVPTDGSEAAAIATEEAVELAELNDAELHVLYVIEPIPLGKFAAGAEPASAEWDDVVDEQRTEGEDATASVAALADDHDVDVVEAIEHGQPNEQILGYADEHGIDAIVMGTHGRSGAGRLVVGSVTEKVVRKSDVPVLTIRKS
ncbi:universal stress protein [Natronobacterium gregoryi]|nr:universal stress protein [Natronobacterium gregoryi]AFZ74701.1 universal stress protein UspA-like protein [Natronobacterium gregoryi SP2]PLK20946.1 universal stress protein [Natronobacterium gregoryi SP2]SFJ04531.1 Nucleotide-binding universal stress protein, UspA family [Natronobacterium gregoryi]